MLALLFLVGLEAAEYPECGDENYLNGYCYTLSSTNVVYGEALARCESVNSSLLSEMSGSEIQLVLSRLHRTVWLAPEQGDQTQLQASKSPKARCPAFYPINDKRVWQISCSHLLSYICKKRVMPSTAAPPTTPGHSSSGCMVQLDSANEATLKAHNLKRALHKNTFPMCWNWGLQVSAEQYARVLGLRGGVDHDPDNQHGENIYSILWSETRSLDWYYQHAVDQWYNEIRYYDWGRPGSSSSYGHFAQLVWSSSYLVGCGHGYGLNRMGKKRIVVVCRYSPSGSRADNSLYKSEVQSLKVAHD